MQDCISQASSLTLYLGWGSWLGLITTLCWMIYRKKSRRVSVPLLLIILLHPMLWGRFSEPCTTDIHHSILLFLGLGIAVLVWGQIRPTLEEKREGNDG